jgi:hypothetical protein
MQRTNGQQPAGMSSSTGRSEEDVEILQALQQKSEKLFPQIVDSRKKNSDAVIYDLSDEAGSLCKNSTQLRFHERKHSHVFLLFF